MWDLPGDAKVIPVSSPQTRQILPVRHALHDRVSSIALQVRQPTIGGGRIPSARCCRSTFFRGRVQMLPRHCSHAYGPCHDEHDDLRSPRRKSLAPPVDICCAVFDSRRQLLLNRSLTKYRVDPCTSRLTKWRLEFSTAGAFVDTCGVCRKMIVDGTEVYRSAYQSGHASLQGSPYVLIVSESVCCKIRLLLRTSAVITIECDGDHIQVSARLLTFMRL